MKKLPLPVFDTLEQINSLDIEKAKQSYVNHEDSKKAISFLKCYQGSKGTFNSYRRETERLLQWCSLIANKTLNQLKRDDIEAFLAHQFPKTTDVECGSRDGS